MDKLLLFVSQIVSKSKRNIRKILLAATFGLFALLSAFILLTYLYYSEEISNPNKLVAFKNSGITFYDNQGSFLYAVDGTRNVEVIPANNIPDSLKKATIAIEDKNFYQHFGISLKGIIRSVVNNIKSRDIIGSGGSTITQQLVKNSLLSQNKSIIRKLQEIILATVVERRYSKEEVLQLYLGIVSYGEGSYGAQEATKIYFDKNISDLNLAESAMLAGLTAAPSLYSPFSNPNLAKERQKLVLSKMSSLGYISDNEYKDAASYNLNFASQEKDFIPLHFVLWLKGELEKSYDRKTLENSGLKVYTTLDKTLQDRAETIIESRIRELRPYGATNAGLLAIENKTGEILAMVGSADWFDENYGKYNTVFANRQPGSSFKPIVYLTAFLNGYTPATVLHDKPTEFEKGYKPTNYDLRFRGDVLARRALASSINVPTVELGLKVGVEEILKTAKKLGITTLNKEAKFYGPNLALGGGEVKLAELTNVFATLARGGVLIPITGIRKISDKHNEVIFDNQLVEKRVVDPEYAFLITDILSDNEARSEVFGRESLLKLSRLTAVKTGTTDEFKDSWTIGYSPSITTGVWVGDNENRPMDSIVGVNGAAPIWHEFMEFTLQLRPIETFKKPQGVVSALICRNNGLLVKKGAKNIYQEFFIKGTTPTKSSDCE